MRADLLHAYASVDWAISQLPAFQQRINTWLKDNVSVGIKELETSETDNLVVAIEKEPFPLTFNVEGGAYINAIRSALDILASSLSARNRVVNNPEAHFPIFRCLYDFIDPLIGLESIKWLSASERTTIKSLKPYAGGNKLLFALHQFDIMRKHRRLLDVAMNPYDLSIIGHFRREDFKPVATGWIRGIDNETVLGFFAKGRKHPKLKIATYITLNEPTLLEPQPIVIALNEFGSLARSIIALFE